MGDMTGIKLNQLKKASEAYAELRVLHTDPNYQDFRDSDVLLTEALKEEVGDDFPSWSVFRDGFIADWVNNRTIVNEKEADVMFDTLVENAIAEIEAAEANAADVVQESTPIVALVAPVVVADAPVAKRRGRPPGSGKAKTVKVKAVKEAKVKKVKVVKAKKVAAKKKSTSSVSSKAQAIVEKYVERKWARKDIIAKLVEQLGMKSTAYAGTLYQKFA